MENIYTDGIVVEITGNIARIDYESGGFGFISMDKMPKGVEVGDRVIVTTETTLKSVTLAN